MKDVFVWMLRLNILTSIDTALGWNNNSGDPHTTAPSFFITRIIGLKFEI